MEKNIPYISAEDYLDSVCQSLPVVNQVIGKYGDTLLSEYLQKRILTIKPSYQPRDDLLEVVYRYAAPLLGNAVARRAASDLARYPVVLTANHHGVDYFSQSMQGSLIFSLNTITGAISATTILIFSFGNIPLNNSTYPRGLLLYHVHPTQLETLPKRLPLFPDKLKRCMVSVTPAFDQMMVHRAEERFDNMIYDGQISPKLAEPLHEIFREDYCEASVITLPTYSQQAVMLNNRIWKRLFSELSTVPEMVYLESEKIARALLESDLSNPKSLAWSVMFDPILREFILKKLDGVRGCWNLKGLAQRLRLKNLSEAQREEILDGCGTVFFWGIDPTGRRIPLHLQTEGSHTVLLRGIDDYNNIWEFPYTPEAIISKLQENKLLSSLFTCFLTLSFARGLVCVGGCLQGEYLLEMQRGLVSALQNIPRYQDVALFVAQVPTDHYQDCMLAVMCKADGGYLIPAGPVEIIAGGGITRNNVEQMLSLTVREAHLAGLLETEMNFTLPTLRIPDRKTQLAADCFKLLGKKIVIK